MPNLITKAINFTKAMAKYAASGFKNVSEETYNERISICQTCPLNKEGECMLCGCPVDRKALLATESCPDSRWTSEETTSSTRSSVSGVTGNTGGRRGCQRCKARTR